MNKTMDKAEAAEVYDALTKAFDALEEAKGILNAAKEKSKNTVGGDLGVIIRAYRSVVSAMGETSGARFDMRDIQQR